MASHIGPPFFDYETFFRSYMKDKVREFISRNNLIKKGDHVIIGVSGGPDSMCLLSVLREIFGESITMHVIHVNHGIRETADMEADFVINICGQLGIEAKVFKVDVLGYAKEYGMSTEEAGRIIRYKLFEDVFNKIEASEADKRIAVAHNMNDNAETMLLNMFRGSSLGGLVGIKASRGHIVRPLLHTSRAEIEEYLDKRGIGYCIDESNHTDDYARNRVRHHILPIASETINSGAIKNMMELSAKVEAAKDYIDSQVLDAFDDCCKYDLDDRLVHIDKDKFEGLHPYIKSSLLYKAFEKVALRLKDVESKHVDIMASVFDMDIGKKVDLPYGVQAVRDADGISLSVYKENDSKSIEEYVFDLTSKEDGCIDLDDASISYKILEASTLGIEDSIEGSIPVAQYTKWFDADKIEGELLLRNRHDGDYLIINDEGNTQKLKNYFINAKIDKDKRDKYLLVADGSHIVWIIDGRISSHYKVDKDTRRILEITYIRKEV